jgi:hypothetical protein
MRVALQLEDLQQRVAQIGDRVVLACLLVEGVGIHFPQPGSAGQLHQDTAGRLDVLSGEQPGPVAGQLGFAEPLL